MTQATWIIDQLVAQGVTTFCIAPGSRSVPLALAAAEHPQAEIVVHFDERGLGFYGLGFGKGAQKPAAIIVTSGTAVANLLPATMEAYHSQVPLILLTADRPHELRDCGGNQTADQVKLFASTVRWGQDLSPHLDEKAIRSITAQAVFHSRQGPVHLNCPFQEPLYTPSLCFSKGKRVDFSFPTLISPPMQHRAKRGVILLGPLQDPTPVLELAKRMQWPVFADLLSQARRTPTPEQITHFDFLLSSWESPPDLLLHFGGRFIAKHLPAWAPNTQLIHVSPHTHLQDPERRLTTRVISDIAPFCARFEADSDPNWLTSWQEANSQIHTSLIERFDSPFTESHAIANLSPDHPIFFGNSMPIRHADHFFFPQNCPPIFANRGLSGIDGNIATAAGIAHALQSPLIAFLGDQTTLHDINSLPLIKKEKILLIISNNFGGAIFDYLPVAKSPHANTICAAAHHWTFEQAAKMFDIPYICTEGPLSHLPEHGVVELVTNRVQNRTFSASLTQHLQLR